MLLLIGGKRSKRSRCHPFDMVMPLCVRLVVSMILFSAAPLQSMKASTRSNIPNRSVMLSGDWCLLVAMVLEGFSLRTAVESLSRSRSPFRYIRESREPELPVVLLEDAGALVGLELAFTGISLSMVTGNGLWDGIGSVSIEAAASDRRVLALEMASMLVGESAIPKKRTHSPGTESTPRSIA